MHAISRFVLALSLMALLAGCTGHSTAVSAGQKVLQSEKPRVAASNIDPNDSRALADGNMAFASDLYHAIGQGEDNLFFSPYSISLALAMTYAGAKGETARQMADVLHFTIPQERLHPAFNALDQELASRKDAQGQGADGKGFRFNIVNDLWGQQDYQFLPGFLDLLSANYGAGMRLVDFKKDPEAARLAINDYIAKATEQRIKDLIAKGMIDPQTRLVLTNAIYFNAAWLFPFDKGLTKNAPFTRLDGKTVSVPMMQLPNPEYMNYQAGEGYQAVAIPYEGMKMSMVILLPDRDNFANFEGSLDAAKLQTILAGLDKNSGRVSLQMPKFQMENEFSLGKTLSGMGMKDATTFGPADFSGMDGTRDLFISEVVHKTFVKVDEAGTEAAAATAVMMAAGAMPAEPVQLTIDRPFLFMIVDRPTSTVLFFGRVTEPK